MQVLLFVDEKQRAASQVETHESPESVKSVFKSDFLFWVEVFVSKQI